MNGFIADFRQFLKKLPSDKSGQNHEGQSLDLFKCIFRPKFAANFTKKALKARHESRKRNSNQGPWRTKP